MRRSRDRQGPSGCAPMGASLGILCRAYLAASRFGSNLYSPAPSYQRVSRRTEQQYAGDLTPEAEQFAGYSPSWCEIDPQKHPVIAEINQIAQWLMAILGPMFWTALIVLSLWAQAVPVEQSADLGKTCTGVSALSRGPISCWAHAAPAAIAGDSR